MLWVNSHLLAHGLAVPGATNGSNLARAVERMEQNVTVSAEASSTTTLPYRWRKLVHVDVQLLRFKKNKNLPKVKTLV